MSPVSLHESETLELKRSTAELGEALKSIAAMLNKHQQGELYFGLKDNGDVIGQDVSAKTLRDLSQSIHQHIEPKIFPKIGRVEIEGKDCVRVQFEGSQVPYFCDGRAYVRVADQNRQISPHELERLFGIRSSKKWESESSRRKPKEANARTIHMFMREAREAKRINFTYQNAPSTLQKLGLVKNGRLLRAAEALFCNENILEIQAAIFAGTDKLTFLDIQSFKGNLFTLLDRGEDYLREHMSWRVEFGQMRRKEIPEVPIKAIREALVNSLVHRDYTNAKSNEIAIYKDRIEIYNPGEFLPSISPQEYANGEGESILRNTLIAETVYKTGRSERWGSGFKRIYDECKAAGVQVEFKPVATGFVVVFWRREGFGSTTPNTTPKTTPKTDERMLELLGAEPTLSKENLAARLKLSLAGIKYHIKKMNKEGLIRWVGPTKGGHWEVIKP